MKKLIFTVLGLFVAGSLFAISPVKFGVKVGVNFPNAGISDIPSSISNLKIDSKTSFHAGVMARVNVAFLHIQPEILYSMDRFDSNQEHGDLNMNSVDFPVLIGYKIAFFRINAGPVFHLASSMGYSDNDNKSDIKLSRPACGYAVGAGVTILGKLDLDLRYGGDFSKSTQNITTPAGTNYEYRSKFTNVMLSAGWMF